MDREQKTDRPATLPARSFETACDPHAAPEQGEYRFGSGCIDTEAGAETRRYAFERKIAYVPQPEPVGTPDPAGGFAGQAADAEQAVTPSAAAFRAGAAPKPTAGTEIPAAWRAFQAAVPPREEAEPETRKRSARLNGWTVLAVILALLLGGFAGFVGYQLWSEHAAGRGATAASEPTVERTEQMELSAIYRKNVDAVVSILCRNEDGEQPTTGGSGFLIDERGYLLTNYHVIQGAASITVILHDGRSFPAELVNADDFGCDAALLRIEADGLKAAALGDSDRAEIGAPVCTIGNPLGELADSLSAGYLSARDRVINVGGITVPMLQTDAAINSGNSGGPLFNSAGEVIGIVTTKYSGETTSGATVEGLGFAIPINAVRPKLEALIGRGAE